MHLAAGVQIKNLCLLIGRDLLIGIFFEIVADETEEKKKMMRGKKMLQ